MPGVIRYAAGLASALLLLLAAVGVAGANTPEGPRLTFIRWSLHPESMEILSTDAVGGAGETILRAGRHRLPIPLLFSSPSWSPDGSRLAFSGLVRLRRGSRRIPPVAAFLISSDGSGLTAVPGGTGGFEPIFSPDGNTLAFTRLRERRRKNEDGGEDRVYESAAIWLVDLTSGESRQLTPWRNHLSNVASSFSPDGETLAVSRTFGRERIESVAMRLDGNGSTVLSRGGFAPMYSPDGSHIALLRGHRRVFLSPHSRTVATVTDLFVMKADGSELHRLTDTPRLAESAAGWDPSGRRLVYTENDVASEAGLLGFGNSIMEINPDGSCKTLILSDPGLAVYAPAWQPGPGRASGPLDCG